jgi:hypothetical protein
LSDKSTSNGTLLLSPWSFTFTRTNTESLFCKGQWWDEYRADAFNYLGLTFQNAIGVAWELTKFSFVYDWFGNVGDLIYANLPRVNTNPLGGGVTFVQQLTLSVACTGFTNIDPANWTLTGGYGDSPVITERTVTRRRRTDSGRLVINSDFRLDNYIRAADAMSLVIQRLATIGF